MECEVVRQCLKRHTKTAAWTAACNCFGFEFEFWFDMRFGWTVNSRPRRSSYSGNTLASQARAEGSIPFDRSYLQEVGRGDVAGRIHRPTYMGSTD